MCVCIDSFALYLYMCIRIYMYIHMCVYTCIYQASLRCVRCQCPRCVLPLLSLLVKEGCDEGAAPTCSMALYFCDAKKP